MAVYILTGLNEEPTNFKAATLEDAVRSAERAYGCRLIKLDEGEGQVVITSLAYSEAGESVPLTFEGEFRVEPFRVIK